jgi:hypothetical protein
MASVDRMWRILVSVASQLVPTRESQAGSRFSVVALLDVSEAGTTTIIALIIAPGDSDSSKVLTPVSRFLSHFFGPKGPDPGPTPPRNLLHHRLFRWSAQVTVSLDRRPIHYAQAWVVLDIFTCRSYPGQKHQAGHTKCPDVCSLIDNTRNGIFVHIVVSLC